MMDDNPKLEDALLQYVKSKQIPPSWDQVFNNFYSPTTNTVVLAHSLNNLADKGKIRFFRRAYNGVKQNHYRPIA